MKNILFIAPHPDDEIVGAAFIIKKILKKKNVFIFFPTNGLISREKMWPWERYGYQRRLKLRLKEMKRSVKALNIRKFYLQNLPSRTLKDNISKTYIKIKKIIKSEKIDTIFCPAYEGGHQDHDVSNFICSRLKKVSCTILKTVKGKGIKKMENKPEWHYWNNISKKEFDKYFKSIRNK